MDLSFLQDSMRTEYTNLIKHQCKDGNFVKKNEQTYLKEAFNVLFFLTKAILTRPSHSWQDRKSFCFRNLDRIQSIEFINIFYIFMMTSEESNLARCNGHLPLVSVMVHVCFSSPMSINRWPVKTEQWTANSIGHIWFPKESV